jgi:hypothetical protein
MAERKRQTKMQNNTQKPKDRTIRSSQKAGGEVRCSGKVGSSSFTFGVAIVAATIHLLFFEIYMIPTMYTDQALCSVTR